MTINRTYVLVSMLIFVLCGCAVQTGSVDAKPKYTIERIGGTTVKITFEGNRQQDEEEVRQYLIYYCAKATLKNEYLHFVVIADESYKHVGKKEFLDSDMIFETTTTMSGGVNTRVRSSFGAQDTDVNYVGIFTIRMLKNAETHSVDASMFVQDFKLRNN